MTRVVASCVDKLVNSGKGQELWSQLSQSTREALRRLDDRGEGRRAAVRRRRCRLKTAVRPAGAG